MKYLVTLLLLSSVACAETATQVMPASDVITWKRNVYRGLTEVGENPFDFMADIYLLEVLKIDRIPKGGTTEITVPRTGANKLAQVEGLVGITRALKAINTINRIAGENHTAFNILIQNMTQTIAEPAQRERILRIIHGTQ